MPVEPLDILIRVREQMGAGTNSAIGHMRRLRGEIAQTQRASQGVFGGGISRKMVGRIGRFAALGMGTVDVLGDLGGGRDAPTSLAGRVDTLVQQGRQLSTAIGMMVAFANPLAGLGIILGGQIVPALLGTADAAHKAAEAIAAINEAGKTLRETQQAVAAMKVPLGERDMVKVAQDLQNRLATARAAHEKAVAALPENTFAGGVQTIVGNIGRYLGYGDDPEAILARAEKQRAQIQQEAYEFQKLQLKEIDEERARRARHLETEVLKQRLENEDRVYDARRVTAAQATQEQLRLAKTEEEKALLLSLHAASMQGIDIAERKANTITVRPQALAPGMEDRFLTGVREAALEKAITDPVITIIKETNSILTRIDSRGIVLAPARLGGR